MLDNKDKLAKNSFKQLCASAAIIGASMILGQWGSFVPDLLNIANSSEQKLLTILEIFITLHKELQEKGIDQNAREKVKIKKN